MFFFVFFWLLFFILYEQSVRENLNVRMDAFHQTNGMLACLQMETAATVCS